MRVLYVGPAPLAGPDAGVRYAKAPTNSSAPAIGRRPADEDIFEEASATSVAVTPLVKPPEAVSISTLAPLPSAGPAHSGPISEARAAAAQASRIQAGAFSDQENARRAAAQLAATGTATIEPFERGGMTLYRVTLPAPEDEAEAYALRDKVAAVGFADARVLRP